VRLTTPTWLEGGREVAAQPQPVRHDKGVAGVDVVHVYISLFQVGRQAGIEGVKGDRPGLERRGAVERLEEGPPVPTGRLSGNMNRPEVAVDDLLGDLAHAGLCARAVVVHGEAPSALTPLAVHQTDSVWSAVDVHAHQQGIGHTQCLLIPGVSRLPMAGHPWVPMRATAAWGMRTPPAVGMRVGSAGPAYRRGRTRCV
jgi:hypothetical protein